MTDRLSATDALPMEERLEVFGIGPEVMEVVRGFRPLVQAEIPKLLDILGERVEKSPVLKASIGASLPAIREIEVAHVLTLFEARFDDAYMRSAEAAAEGEYTLGMGARTRLSVLSGVAGHLLRKVALRNPLWAIGAAEKFGAILRVILLDCSIAILLHERAAQQRIDARRTSVEENVQSFGGTADRVCAEIHAGASRLINGAESLSLAMTRAHESTEGATHASAHVSGAMQQTVLAAAALENTLFEIRTDAKLSAKASVVTAEKTDLADTCVKELLTCAAQIGSVTDVISSIASQTSLLALNATIEAARAGAAGRSFAVVAGEVKELAGRTAQATLEVGEHIQRIQDAARRSVEALEEVSARIAEQRDLCQRIEAAVVDQTSSTGQIREEAGVVAEAASATLAAITSIQDTVANARSAFEDTRMWATEMSVASDGLAVEFRDFASRLRRA